MTALHDTAAAMASLARSMLELAADSTWFDPVKSSKYMEKHFFYARHAAMWAKRAAKYDAERMELEDEK